MINRTVVSDRSRYDSLESSYNQSLITKAISQPEIAEAMIKGYYKPEQRDYFEVGKIVENKLTNQPVYHKELPITITDAEQSLCDHFLNVLDSQIEGTELSESQKNIFLQSFKDIGFYANNKEDFKMKMFDKLKPYILMKHKNPHIKFMSLDMVNQIELALDNAAKLPNYLKVLLPYFSTLEQSGSDNIEVLFDVMITFPQSVIHLEEVYDQTHDEDEEYETVMCKGLLDMVVLNNTKNTVQIIDLKTTSAKNFDDFRNSVLKYRYDIQGSFYHIGLRKGLTINGISLKSRVFLPPILIGLSKTTKAPPFIGSFTNTDLRIAAKGMPKREKDNSPIEQVAEITGWLEMLQWLRWRERNNIWTKPPDFIEVPKFNLYGHSITPYDI